MSFWPEVEDLSDQQHGIDLDRVGSAAQQAIDMAVGLITGGGKQLIEAGTLTEVLQADGTNLLHTSQIPVRAITSVTITGSTVASSEYAGSTADLAYGVMRRTSGCAWGIGLVTVTYDYGYLTCPIDLWGVVLSVAARRLSNPLGLTGGTAPGNEARWSPFPLELTRTEKAIVDSYQPTPSRTVTFPDRRRTFPR